MFSKLKNKSIIWIISTRFIFILLAAGMFYYGGSLNLIKLLHPMILSEVTEDNMKDAYVTGDVVFLYGEYMTTNSYEDGKNKGRSSVSMIITPNRENYIGMEIPKKQISAYEEAAEECYDNWDDADWILDNPFHVTGTIQKMDYNELAYFKNFVGEIYREPDFLPYVLKIGYLGDKKLSEMIFYTIGGLIFLAIFVIGIIKALTGMYQKPIRQFLAEQSNPAYEKDRLEAAWQQAVNIENMYAMKDYVIIQEGATSRIMRPWDIVWIYKTVTSHRTNGIPTGKSYAVTLATIGGKQYNLKSKKKGVDNLLESVKRELPGAIVGFTPELKMHYQYNRTLFLQKWNEIRNSNSQV